MSLPFAERLGRLAHASDARLLQIVAGARETSHVASCAACQARLAALRAWASGVAAEAGAMAEEVFTADRLAAQKREILRKLESAGRSARVIAFPMGAPLPAVRSTGRALGWAVGAAAAGLIVGIASGRLFDPHTAGPAAGRSASQAAASVAAPPAATASDEALLLDAAYDRVSIDALQTIDDLTPRAREITLASMPRSRR